VDFSGAKIKSSDDNKKLFSEIEFPVKITKDNEEGKGKN
jgi:hypothetical protein